MLTYGHPVELDPAPWEFESSLPTLWEFKSCLPVVGAKL